MLFLLTLSAAAQTVAPGRFATLRTPHFRVHYPVRAEAFARDVASRIESMHARVTLEVGWTPKRRMDVVVVDPYGQANGQAIADDRAPRMRLYASPPPASASIGHQRDWVENLVIHEDAHLVHLTWPSRNPLGRLVQRVGGFGPLALRAPGWVVEGYATLVEGRLTGAGRPNDDARTVWLRLLARTGRFPSYDELMDVDRHRGGEHVYLVGSAFLEWIEREHPGSLPDLWRRMSARRNRGFEVAFAGLYGESPPEAYGRFLSDVMAEARPSDLADRSTRVAWGRGDLGPPALSPDGSRVAVPVSPDTGPPSLVVYETAIPEDEAERREERVEDLLAADPDDVPAEPPAWIQRPVDTTRVHLGRTASQPRFVDDDTVIFDAWTADVVGRLRPDLFEWDVDTGEERRITRRADVTQPDPAPDGGWAVAVRQAWGQTQIVEVDLASGRIAPITELRVDVQVDGPRVSPDGEGLVWLENRGEGYGWMRRDRTTGEQRWHPTSLDGPHLRSLAWGPDGALLAEAAWDGQLGVFALDVGDGPVRLTGEPLTLPGGARAPAFAPDGAAWVLTDTPDGTALHRLPPDTPVPVSAGGEVLSRASDEVDAPAAERGVAVRRPYGLGHWSWIPLGGLGIDSFGEGQLELAVTGGDLMGRYSARAWISGTVKGAGVSGASVTLGSRGASREWGLTGFVGRDRRLDLERAGASLRRSGRWRTSNATTVAASVDGLLERVDLGGGGQTRAVAGASAGFGVWEPRRRGVALGLRSAGQVGRTGDAPFRWVTGAATLRLGRELPLEIDYSAGHTTGTTLLDRWSHGGPPVSVWPGPATATWLADPTVAALRQTGSTFDRIDVAFGTWQLRAFATRTRVADTLAGGVTVVGVRAGTTVSADPFSLVVADGGGTVGVGRTVEDPERGWTLYGGQWFAFATWTWR